MDSRGRGRGQRGHSSTRGAGGSGGENRSRGFWRGRFGGRFWNRRGGKKLTRGATADTGRSRDDGQIDDSALGDDSREVTINDQSRGRRGTSRAGRRNASPTDGGAAGRSPDSDSDTQRNVLTKLIRGQWVKKYPGYLLYFPTKYSAFADLPDKLKTLMKFCRKLCEESTDFMKKIEEKEVYDFKYEDLASDKDFCEDWPTFCEDLVDFPQDTISACGLALHQVVYERTNGITNDSTKTQKRKRMPALDDSDDENPGEEQEPTKIDIPYIRVGIFRANPVIPLKALKASMLGKFVTVRGAVVRTSEPKVACTLVEIECPDCEGTFMMHLTEGRWQKPKSCQASDECNNKKDFEPVYDSRMNKYMEHTTIRIQDVQHCDLEHGRVPRTIDCILRQDLIHHSNAGEVLTLCGVVKMSEEENGPPSADQNIHNLYLDVVAVKNHKESDRTMGGHWFSFSNADYYAVKEIYECENLFRLLVASLCPSIYGHDMVKAGMLLALFGGTSQDPEKLGTRADINVLVVGDPGMGKSQILKIVSEVAPRGVYVCGTGTTNSGLTVTLVKDGDDFSLEAGTLVMGDKGVCCIDEFDKMPNQHNALLEAMEQQSVSIAKAGVFRTLPARTSVIAAANPVGGHYDNTKTVAENIKIGGPLLSRFDLIFLLQDKSDNVNDRGIIDHILGFATAENSRTSQHSIRGEDRQLRGSLADYLKLQTGEEIDLIPHDLLRKYIAYAKQYVNPKLEPDAAEILKEFYLDLRKNHRSVDSTPVTTRQLESLKRLAEARAKCELREVATSTDAHQAVEIFKFCMSGVYDDDSENAMAFAQEVLTGSRINSGVSPAAARKISKNVAKKLLAKIEFTSNHTGQDVFSVEEIQDLAESIGLDSGIHRLIDSLNNDGYLLKTGHRQYKFQCAA